MTRYAALIRGINVGRHNRLLMTDLRALAADVGCTDVVTILQSGNVVFASTSRPEKIAEGMGAGIARLIGREHVGVIVRDAAYLRRLVAENPYVGRGVDERRLGAVFLAERPKKAALTALEVPGVPPDSVTAGNRVLYTCAPATGSAQFPDFTKLLGQTVTARNWATTCKVAQAVAGS